MRDAGLGAATCCFLGAAVAWLPGTWSETVVPYALVYALLVFVHTGARLGRKTYIIDMAGTDKRALYVALSNTFTGALILVLGGVVGALAQWLGPAALLVLLAIMALAAAASAQRLVEVE